MMKNSNYVINSLNDSRLGLCSSRYRGGGRINYLDALKCLGILLVVEGHVRKAGMGQVIYDSVSGLMLYSFNMPLFFFVSGFLAYKAEITTNQLVNKLAQKFTFLVIPAIVFFVYSCLLHHENPFCFIWDGFDGYWFTICLWYCFVLYYIIVLMLPDNKFRDMVLIGIAILGVLFLSFVGNYGPKILDLNRLTKYFQFFVLGILAVKYRNFYYNIIQSELLKAMVMLLFFGLLFTINYDFWPKPVFHLLRDIVLRYLGTFAVVAWFVCHAKMFDRDSRFMKVLLNIGQKSLSIYLLHYFFFPDITCLKSWFAEYGGITIYVISFIYTIAITITSYIFILFLSNSKFVKKYVLGQK